MSDDTLSYRWNEALARYERQYLYQVLEWTAWE